MEISTVKELPTEIYYQIIDTVLPGPDSYSYYTEKKERNNLSLVNKKFYNHIINSGEKCFYSPRNTTNKVAKYYGLYKQMSLADQFKNIFSISLIEENNNCNPEEIVASLEPLITQDPLIVNYCWLNCPQAKSNPSKYKSKISILGYACMNFFYANNHDPASKTNPVRLLLEAKALPDQSIFECERNETEWLSLLNSNTALQYNQKKNITTMLTEFVEYKTNCGFSEEKAFSKEFFLSHYMKLVTNKAINPKEKAQLSSRLHLSSLSFAINYKSPSIHNTKEIKTYIKYIIDSGISINQRDIFLRTALHWAALNNHDFIKPLIKNNADINALDMYGKKPLDYLEKEYKLKIQNLFVTSNKN